MLLTADIGNTNIDIGLFNGDKLVQRVKLPACIVTPADWESPLEQLKCENHLISAALLCSVCPSITPVFIKTVHRMFNVVPKILESEAKLKLKNRYSTPGAVGADRIANAYAAWRLFGLPALVVDLGTAITIDAISAQAEYLGGVIAPGIAIAAEALAEKTALLSKVTPRLTPDVLGRDTISAIQSGITHGSLGLIMYLIDKRQHLHPHFRAIKSKGNIGHLEAGLVAAVKTLAFKLVSVDGLIG